MRILCVFLAIPVLALAQANFGRISGTVTDSSGGVVPGARVTVGNEATRAERILQTSEVGTYIATNLPAGIYSVKVEHAGFQPIARAGLDLVADGRLNVDFRLQPGGTTETITVQATAGETVNTVSGELARVVNIEQVQNLALNGRNYMQLVSLVPGTALLDEDQLSLTTSLSTTQQSVNGNRGNSNNLMVDGGYNSDSRSEERRVGKECRL